MTQSASSGATKPVKADTEEEATRPALPPLLIVGLSLWIAAALAYPLLQDASIRVCLGAAAAGALTVAPFLVHGVAHRRIALAHLVVFGLASGLMAAATSAALLHHQQETLIGAARPWTIELTEDARLTDFGAQATGQLVSDDGKTARARVCLAAEDAGLLRGSRLKVSGALETFSAKAQSFAWERGLVGTIDGKHREEEVLGSLPLLTLRSHALEVLEGSGGDQAPLLEALVCGYRRPLEEAGEYQAYQLTGLAHLVAVSGAHLSVVSAFVLGLLRLTRLSRRTSSLILGLFLLAYVVFTGLPVSAIRAALMTATALFSFAGKRRASALNGLGLCLVVFVAIDVPSAPSASFFLSAGSTLGILLFSRLFRQAIPGKGRVLTAFVRDPLALTASSALLVQPYSAALFAQLPLVAPLANVVATPLFTLACVAGFAGTAAALLFPAAASLFIGAASLACQPLSSAVGLIKAIPFGCIPIDADPTPLVALSALAAVLLWAWWPSLTPRATVRLGGAACAVLIVLVAAAPLLERDEIVMFDVGQGDAFLVRSQGQALLIDTGNQERLLKEALGRHRVFALDAVAISHHDDDHCGALDTLRGVTGVSRLLVARDAVTCPCASCVALMRSATSSSVGAPLTVTGLAVGGSVSCGRFTLTALWPQRFSDEGGNGDSLSFYVTYRDNNDEKPTWTALFCGDAEGEEIAAMMQALPVPTIDVLKVGHHGSRVSLDHGAAEALNPTIALISAGEGNRYGHPTAECLEALQEQGTTVLRTDQQGDATLSFTAQKIMVRTQHETKADQVQ
ncbi:DNA internalization-related competence protein ComEC/Rec2 [uncultured Adlercreutzia sp.]|uniref:DNA internalization-related competence protein ComEC/Rec2 n=1 Tax=uncultured Adlercreutzia sp. TaxID=875803 RepID=UPI00272ED2D9|nr:DNA internalization-related competence protein ComEC/Rec2 [uncultured Adlercreutzia sp.]